MHHPMLLVASGAELPLAERVWGTGGWLPPDERAALDWLTLAKLSGWAVTVTRQNAPRLEHDLSAGSRWIVVACEPDDLDVDFAGQLLARLQAEPLLVVARTGRRDSPFSRLAGVARRPDRIVGRSVTWHGPGAERGWNWRRPLEAAALELSAGATAWATLDGAPLIAARSIGCGAVASLGFEPSEVRDHEGAGTALLRHLLIWGALAPVAWHDLEGTMVLRMDDAGGAQNVHLRSWSYAKLTEADWAAVGSDLKRRQGRLSIGYISGWVDDGDPARGSLEVAGQPVERVPGRIHPSPLVSYHSRARPATINDYHAEYRGIQELRGQGLADVELHGYTHMYPDPTVWAKAPDRFETESWYRELGHPAEMIIRRLPSEQHPLVLGLDAMRSYFGVVPTTVIFPGDEFTNAAVERALDLGLRLVSSYYLAMRHRDRFCWTQHVCAPYLDEVDAAWFDSGLPVIGYFHDQDLAVHGVGWLETCLDRWLGAGARRLLDFRELAGIVGRCVSLEEDARGARLVCTAENAPELVRPLTVGMRWPGDRLPARLHALLDGREFQTEVEPVAPGVGRVTLPSVASSGHR